MLTDSVGQEFGQDTVGTPCLCPQNLSGVSAKKIWSWEWLNIWGSISSDASSCLAGDAWDPVGPQMGLSAPTCGLSMWPGLPVSMVAGLQSKCPKTQKIELSAFFFFFFFLTSRLFVWGFLGFFGFFFYNFLFFIFWPHHAACGILVPQPGIAPAPPAPAAWILNHWATREVPSCQLLKAKTQKLAQCHFHHILLVRKSSRSPHSRGGDTDSSSQRILESFV